MKIYLREQFIKILEQEFPLLCYKKSSKIRISPLILIWLTD